MNKTVTIVIDHLRNDGTPRFIVKLAYWLKSRGVNTKVVYLNNASQHILSKFENIGVLVEHYPVKTLRCCWALHKLRQLLTKEEKQYTVISFLFWNGIILTFLSLLGRKNRLVISVRGNNKVFYSKFEHFLFKLCLRRCDAIVYNSLALLQQYQNEIGVSTVSHKCIKNFVELPELKSSRSAKLGTSNSSLMILSVGRLSSEKGFDVLLKAYKLLSGKQINLSIVGEGRQLEPLQALADTLEISVHFVGGVDEAAQYYQQADIYIQPSRFEGMPNALLEAMSYGVACIASNIEGISELIEDGKTGLLFESENSQDLASCILKLVEDQNLRYTLGSNARALIEKEFASPMLADQWLEVINS